MATPSRYSPVMIALHWLMALLIIGAFALGFIMTDMRISPTKLQFYAWHKWLGVTVLGLAAFRLISRLLSQVPAPVAGPAWQEKLAAGTHLALYVLMFAVPVSGYLHTYAAGYPVVYLGMFELPAPFPPQPEWKHTLEEIHEVLSKLMLVTLLMHIAGAIKHQVIDKDRIFLRMMPGSQSDKE